MEFQFRKTNRMCVCVCGLPHQMCDMNEMCRSALLPTRQPASLFVLFSSFDKNLTQMKKKQTILNTCTAACSYAQCKRLYEYGKIKSFSFLRIWNAFFKKKEVSAEQFSLRVVYGFMF